MNILNFKNQEVSISGARRLLLAHSFVMAARVFFEIFLNIFIWKLTQDLTIIAWFNIIYLLMHTLTFHAFAGFIKKGSIHIIRRFALFGFALTYLGIYILREDAIQYVIPIAAFIGFFNGMYWICYHVLRFDLTSNTNRGNYTGLEKGLKTFVDIVIPVLGGAIIAVNAFDLGYSNLFLLGSLLFVVSAFIGNVSFPRHDTPKLHVWKTLKLLMKHPEVMKSNVANSLDQFSRGGTVIRLIFPLLLFEVLRSEFELGALISAFAVASVFGSFLFGRFCRYRYYKNALTVSGLIYVLILIIVVLHPSFWIYVIFGILIRFISIAIDIPKRVISENLIETLEDAKSHRVEFIVIREWFGIGLGRLLSLIPLLWIATLEVSAMTALILFMALAAFVEIMLLRSIKVLR